MADHISNDLPGPVTRRCVATVTDIASRRREDDVIGSITLVFGGVNYGTISVEAPYAAGKPLSLYLVPANGTWNAAGGDVRGPIDCLVTDDDALALTLHEAR